MIKQRQHRRQLASNLNHTRQSKGRLYPPPKLQWINKVIARTQTCVFWPLNVSHDLELWSMYPIQCHCTTSQIGKHLYQVIGYSINTQVTYNADTSMCTLNFNCPVWPWPLRYGTGSRSLHIVSIRIIIHTKLYGNPSIHK